jgi:large subunit ribosomal protein L19
MEQILAAFEQTQTKTNLPEFNVGDTVAVHTIIRDGDKQRVQVFKGLVIEKGGKGATKSFTVRKISYGVGVEKIFPLNSQNVSNIEIIKRGKTRRSKLYYLRNRVGKAALKVKAGADMIVEGSAE